MADSRRELSRPGRASRARAELSRVAQLADGLEEYIGFKAAGETFALQLTLVREILKPPPITEVPRARRDVLGIVSVRGKVTTVIDLRQRLGFSAALLTAQTRIMLVEGTDEVQGLLVDEVTQVYRLSQQQIETAALVLGGNLGSHVAGIGRPRVRGLRGDQSAAGDDEVLILLDLAALLGLT